MGMALPRRAVYRVRQFAQAIIAARQPLDSTEITDAHACLPETGWLLFMAMSRADQRHSINVLRSLQQAGQFHPALMQAALLHDCAKHGDGIRLWHRVAVVLLKALSPATARRWESGPAPAPGHWQYPFWAYLNHPLRGAQLAKASGCDPLAAELIRRHQDPSPALAGGQGTLADRLLAALQAADDDN